MSLPHHLERLSPRSSSTAPWRPRFLVYSRLCIGTALSSCAFGLEARLNLFQSPSSRVCHLQKNSHLFRERGYRAIAIPSSLRLRRRLTASLITSAVGQLCYHSCPWVGNSRRGISARAWLVFPRWFPDQFAFVTEALCFSFPTNQNEPWACSSPRSGL